MRFYFLGMASLHNSDRSIYAGSPCLASIWHGLVSHHSRAMENGYMQQSPTPDGDSEDYVRGKLGCAYTSGISSIVAWTMADLEANYYIVGSKNLKSISTVFHNR